MKSIPNDPAIGMCIGKVTAAHELNCYPQSGETLKIQLPDE